MENYPPYLWSTGACQSGCQEPLGVLFKTLRWDGPFGSWAPLPHPPRGCGGSREVMPLLCSWHHFATCTHLALSPLDTTKALRIENVHSESVEIFYLKTCQIGHLMRGSQNSWKGNSLQKSKAATPKALHSLLSTLPLFKQQHIHVLHPHSHTQHAARPPLPLPPTDKLAPETKLVQITVEALKKGQCCSP